MKGVIDSTVIFHLYYRRTIMSEIITQWDVTELLITRINYLELLAGASENAKIFMRKTLREFPVLEFDKYLLKLPILLP